VQHVMVRDEVQVSSAFSAPYVDAPQRSL
jgi:hypothetical protein